MKYDILASKEAINRTMGSLKTRNINVELVATKEDALQKINKIIPQSMC